MECPVTRLAIPLAPMNQKFVFKPLTAAAKQMVRFVALLECTHIRPEVSEDMSPGGISAVVSSLQPLLRLGDWIGTYIHGP
jgi:hypothetical protein